MYRLAYETENHEKWLLNLPKPFLNCALSHNKINFIEY